MPAEKPLLHVDANFQSPYAMSAYVALREKGVAFDLAPVDLERKAQHDQAYVAKSLTQRVPMLAHGGFTLSESSAIDEYVDEFFPGPKLYPAAPRERARARQVQAWLRSDLVPIREERSTEVVFRGARPAPLSADGNAAAQRLFYFAQSLLNGADNLCAAWCIADTDLALMLNRLVIGGDTVPAPLEAYARRQWQRPSVQSWVGMKRSMLA